MLRSNQNQPITKVKHSKVVMNFLIGIWFLVPIFLVRPIKKIYFAPLSTSRIGHFIHDTEILLARIHVEQKEARKSFFVIWIPDSFISNNYIYSIWKSKINIIPYNIFVSSLFSTAILIEKFLKFKLTYRFIGFDGYLKYIHLLNEAPTVFSMPLDDEIECNTILKSKGIDTSMKWVCILARDNKYLSQTFPYLDWDFNLFRNSDIQTYKLAAEFLALKNILVFRMGTNVEKPFKTTMPDKIIDYANTKWRSEKLDVFLTLKCYFFISTGTGLDSIQIATRRPLLIVNQSMPLHLVRSQQNHLFILKKFFSKDKNLFLNSLNYYKLGINKGFTVDNPYHLRSQDLNKLGIEVIDNTSIEIRDATVEMLSMLTNLKNHDLKLSKHQMKFWELFPNVFNIGGQISSRICSKFLQQNPWLIS